MRRRSAVAALRRSFNLNVEVRGITRKWVTARCRRRRLKGLSSHEGKFRTRAKRRCAHQNFRIFSRRAMRVAKSIVRRPYGEATKTTPARRGSLFGRDLFLLLRGHWLLVRLLRDGTLDAQVRRFSGGGYRESASSPFRSIPVLTKTAITSETRNRRRRDSSADATERNK